MKINEILKMTSEERRRKLEELRQELVKLKLQAKTGLLKDTARVRNVKRDIARILTAMKIEESRHEK